MKELKAKELLVPNFRVGDDGGSGERRGRRSGRGGRRGDCGGYRGDRGDREGGRGRGPPRDRGDRPPRQVVLHTELVPAFSN